MNEVRFSSDPVHWFSCYVLNLYYLLFFNIVFDLEATYSAAVLYLYIQLQNFFCSLHSNSSWAAGQPLGTPFTQVFWG